MKSQIDTCFHTNNDHSGKFVTSSSWFWGIHDLLEETSEMKINLFF